MNDEQDIFDAWNARKKRLHAASVFLRNFPKEGEVWIIVLGKNIGSEQNGGISDFSRPVLVVKKFNNQIYWIVPLSTKQKFFDFYYNFTDPEGKKVSIILAQLRLVNIKRFQRKIYEIFPDIFHMVRQLLKKYLS